MHKALYLTVYDFILVVISLGVVLFEYRNHTSVQF